MIFGTLSHSPRIESLHPAFKAAFDYIKSHDLLNAPLGRIEIDGDRLFINNSYVAEPRTAETQVLEAHRAYIDIHVLLQGRERIGWKAIEACGTPSSPYNEADDYLLVDEPADAYVDLRPGDFAIVYPEDAHAPIIGSEPIRKLVVKVLIDTQK